MMRLFSCLGFIALHAQGDPSINPMQDMAHIGNTMVFLAIMIGVVGIGFRIFVASRKRARTAQQQPQYTMPWQPPQPPAHPQNTALHQETILGVFCPRCGVRSASTYCITCGYDLQTVMRQVHGQFTGDRA
jgi:ribosomal protein L37E